MSKEEIIDRMSHHMLVIAMDLLDEEGKALVKTHAILRTERELKKGKNGN